MPRGTSLKRARQERARNLAENRCTKQIKLDVNDENIDPEESMNPDGKKDFAIQCDISPNNEQTNVAVQCEILTNSNQSVNTKHEATQCNMYDQVKISDTTVCGRRLISLSSLVKTMQVATTHSKQCKNGPVRFKGSTKKGLAAKVYFNCGCGEVFIVSTDDEQESLEANEAMAWGCQISATGFQSAVKLLTSLDLPTPCFKTFKKRQDNLYTELCRASNDDMAKWAKREAEIATEKGDFVTVEGVQYPAIMVIVDGGWAKRSYGHSFSSNCGIAVIIGANTKKVIYADTRISSCIICQKTRKPDDIVPIHRCFKNWSQSPTSMESDIILEGFRSSIKTHNLVYTKFIGDGDSSVFSKVVNVYTGIEVQKIECMNHIIKNFTSRLLEIGRNQVRGKDAPKIDLSERERISPLLPRILAGVRRAIIYNSEQKNHWTELRDDIRNVVKHVFGEHFNCRSYFCNKTTTVEENHYATHKNMVCMDPLFKAINRVADMSKSLILAVTSNPAESFMSIAAKYLEGKRKNFGQRYLYTLRMIGAVLCYNLSSFWATEAFRMIKGSEPHQTWERQSILGSKTRGVIRKYRVSKPCKFPSYARQGDWDYGSDPRQWDLPADVRALKIQEKRAQHQITLEKQSEIEQATIEQAESPRWFTERQERITASKAGKIFKLKETTNNGGILNDILGRKHKYPLVQQAMEYGKKNESIAIKQYELSNGLPPGAVTRCGLFVDLQNGELAASPDGLIGNDGILEVKCPYSLFVAKKPAIAWPKVPRANFSFKINKQNQPQLKATHEHFYQILMQLQITKRDWCDYFIWSEYGSVTIRVYRDAFADRIWTELKEKLLKFWKRDLAPELVDSRYLRGIPDYYNSPPRAQTRATKAKAKKKDENRQ